MENINKSLLHLFSSLIVSTENQNNFQNWFITNNSKFLNLNIYRKNNKKMKKIFIFFLNTEFYLNFYRLEIDKEKNHIMRTKSTFWKVF